MIPILVSLAVSACGVTIERSDTGETQRMSQSEFRGYAVSVLRRHNAVVNKLIFLLPDLEHSDQAWYQRLVEAEDQLQEACHPLVSHALDRRHGVQLGLLERLRLPRETATCDRHTTRIERMLKRQASP